MPPPAKCTRKTTKRQCKAKQLRDGEDETELQLISATTSTDALITITLSIVLADHPGTSTVTAANIGASIIAAPGISTYSAGFAAPTAYVICTAKR
jgi:hypothetical protein